MPDAGTSSVTANPVLMLNDLELNQWAAYADQLLVMPIATQHAADQLVLLIDDAERTLAEMERYIASNHQEHVQSHDRE